jgi:hypothetical protein
LAQTGPLRCSDRMVAHFTKGLQLRPSPR